MVAENGQPAPAPAPAPRSTFVTAVAWIFIVLAGFGTVITLLQNVIFQFLAPAMEAQLAVEQAGKDPAMPWIAEFMVRHLRWVVLAMFVAAASTLAGAVGLLKRRNWARRLFIALMLLGVLWNLAGIGFMLTFFGTVGASLSGASGAAGDFALAMNMMIAVNVLITLGFTALFGWIAKRLASAEIRREFVG